MNTLNETESNHCSCVIATQEFQNKFFKYVSTVKLKILIDKTYSLYL